MWRDLFLWANRGLIPGLPYDLAPASPARRDQVTVPIQRKGGSGVTSLLLHIDRVLAGFEEVGHEGVTGIVDANSRHASTFDGGVPDVAT